MQLRTACVRQTDLVRGIIEKTRGDVTLSLRGQNLAEAIRKLSAQLNGSQIPAEDEAGYPHSHE
jgi:hypothetical protein